MNDRKFSVRLLDIEIFKEKKSKQIDMPFRNHRKKCFLKVTNLFDLRENLNGVRENSLSL